MIDLNEKTQSLVIIEKKLITNTEAKFESSYEHWNILNTINHTYSWKSSALKKVELRLDGKEAKFHSDDPIESINKNFYEKTKDYSSKKTIEIINDYQKCAEIMIEKIKGNESSEDLAPQGFDGSVFDYLVYDLIFHPVNHYIFYSVKNDEYGMFLDLEEYIKINRSGLYKDLAILNLNGFMEKDEYCRLFKKGYEWEHDDLYINIKANTL